MTQNQAVHPHYTLVEAAIRLMDANQPAKLNIETLCNQLGVSMSHLQHVFRDWAGTDVEAVFPGTTKAPCASGDQAKQQLAGGQFRKWAFRTGEAA